MPSKSIKLRAAFLAVACLLAARANASDTVRIRIPARSHLTPVQRLNRDGVTAIGKHDYEKAEGLFYKAYLYDPADPFTLNNLGYVSELQGDLERAHKFYELAAKQESNATIDRSSVKRLEGQPLLTAFQKLEDLPMRMNRMNIDGMRLLADLRPFEAMTLFNDALRLDPHNAFTLNNLGVAEESVGDYDDALRHYAAAADTHSHDTVIIAENRSWRGKPVSEMASDSSRRLEEKILHMDPARAHAAMFTVRGVAAINRNDWPAAHEAFLMAYSLDPENAFTLNNRGYVAEHDGDLESAQYFYSRARRANNAGDRIGFATQAAAEGAALAEVASDSDSKVKTVIGRYTQQRRNEKGPVELVPRGGAPGPDTNTESKPDQQTDPNPDKH